MVMDPSAGNISSNWQSVCHTVLQFSTELFHIPSKTLNTSLLNRISHESWSIAYIFLHLDSNELLLSSCILLPIISSLVKDTKSQSYTYLYNLIISKMLISIYLPNLIIIFLWNLTCSQYYYYNITNSIHFILRAQ